MPTNCIEHINHSRIKCEENSCKFILENPERQYVDKITVDGCVYASNTEPLRCDYAINYAEKYTILVELKGSDKTRAARQILATVNDAKFDIYSNKIAIIAMSQTPKFDSSLQRVKKMLLDKKIILISGNSPIEKSLVSICP